MFASSVSPVILGSKECHSWSRTWCHLLVDQAMVFHIIFRLLLFFSLRASCETKSRITDFRFCLFAISFCRQPQLGSEVHTNGINGCLHSLLTHYSVYYYHSHTFRSSPKIGDNHVELGARDRLAHRLRRQSWIHFMFFLLRFLCCWNVWNLKFGGESETKNTKAHSFCPTMSRKKNKQ